ncbi:1-acyl-sn-glycerol-3-phosphate acyltransferase [bacterium]|nr:1-acyl-sn-glycerol-3-phosphate acyltransferase [bacterium]
MTDTKVNYSKRDKQDFNNFKYLFQVVGRFVITKFFFRLYYKIDFYGRENIPKNKNFIIAPNHISYLDPILAAEAVKQPVAYMGKVELFNNKYFAKLLDLAACFAVNREKPEVSSIKTALTVVKTNKWRLGIFPQGGIKRNKKIEFINKGFAILAKQTQTDILPVAITGCESEEVHLFKGRIKVYIGEPISYNQDIDDILEEWGQKISQMADYKYERQYEQKEEAAQSA